MAAASTRSVVISFTGDIQYSQSFPAAGNATAPGDIDVITLAAGNNTISVPNIAALAVAKGCTIVPPSGNANTLTLKGVAGDTGIPLHKTDPTSITFDTPPAASFVLNAGAQIDGVRLIWT